MIKIFTLLPAGNKTADVVLRSSCGKVFLHSYNSRSSPILTGDVFIQLYGLPSLFMHCHPFAASAHCPCYLSQAGDPSSSFHLLIWHLISSLWSRICPGFHLLAVHCLHTHSALLSPSLHLLSRVLTLSVSLSITPFSMSFFPYFSITTQVANILQK